MFGCLSYLACGSGTSRVLGWIIVRTLLISTQIRQTLTSLAICSQSFNGACTVANWLFISSTWLRFNNAIKKQGLDRDTFLPARSRFQPYIGWYTFVFSFVMLLYAFVSVSTKHAISDMFCPISACKAIKFSFQATGKSAPSFSTTVQFSSMLPPSSSTRFCGGQNSSEARMWISRQA